MPRYLVEGAYSGSNDGSPITGDYVVAATPEEAQAMVTKVRKYTDPWHFDRVVSFEDHIKELRDIASRLEAMTEEQVADGWEETKGDLYYEEEGEDEEDADFNPCGDGGPPYDAATATGMYDRD